MTKSIKAALGMARKAGRCQVGMEACVKAIRSGRARLVFLDSSAGRTTADSVRTLAEAKGIPLCVLDGGVRLEDAVGKANARVAVITDPGFLGLFQDTDCKMITSDAHGGAEKE